ncbi:hypothetical protein DB88DRAFT_514241 [Papiliotrema laurentii]|uniref:Uncharacterized protein n=1 Tax=Papiliotrema laurentii TaxID=5418 RepID=A0AAD9FVN4_PAPLA|nr:hypothetical protein DB88DRAFT_514241 [Papiliotrema laurentii]
MAQSTSSLQPREDQLPAKEVAQTRKDLLSKQFLNHIEDIPRNGDPVDLPGLWKKVCRRKQLLFLLAAINLGVQINNVFLQGHLNHYNCSTWTALRLQHFCPLSLVHVLPPSPAPPFTHLAHLFNLAGRLHPLVFCDNWLLSGHVLHPKRASLDRVSPAHILWLYLPFTEKLKAFGYNSANTHRPNVNGEVSSSILGRLMFAFVWPMMVMSESCGDPIPICPSLG